MPLFLLCFVALLIGGGLRTSSKSSLHPVGIVILIACVPAVFLVFFTQYGLHGLLSPMQVLPFLMLPLFMDGVALFLPAVANNPKQLRYFVYVYGIFWAAWCVTLVIANAPWSAQVLGR